MSVVIQSAYAQLRPAERAFVDQYVTAVDRAAAERNERISLALYRPIPAELVDASRGLLSNALVLAAISEKITALAADTELSVPRIAREIATIAFSNMEDYFKSKVIPSIDGDTNAVELDFDSLTREQWAAVESVEIEMDPRNPFMIRKKKIKLHSKLDALKVLATYTGMSNSENPHWKAETAKVGKSAALPDSISQDGAADRYSALING